MQSYLDTFSQNSSIENLLEHMIDSIFGLDNRVWGFAYAFVQKKLIKGHYVPYAPGSKTDVASTHVWWEI